MKKLTSTKKLIILGAAALSIPGAVSLGTILNLKGNGVKATNPFLIENGVLKIDNRDVYFNDADNSIRDWNLKAKPQEEAPIVKIKEEEKPVEPIKEEPIVEPTKEEIKPEPIKEETPVEPIKETKPEPTKEEIKAPEVIVEKPIEEKIPEIKPTDPPKVIEETKNEIKEEPIAKIETPAPEPKPTEKVEPAPAPKPIEKPVEKIVVPPAPAPKPIEKVEPKPKPKPPAEPLREEPVVVKPTINYNTLPTEETVYYELNGKKIKAVIRHRPKRHNDSRDIAAGIASPINYQRYDTPELVSAEITDEVREANRQLAVKSFKSYGFPSNILQDIKTPDSATFSLKKYIDNEYFKKRIDKFRRLIENGDAVVNFLTDEGKRLYPELKKIQDKDVRYIKIISYLDFSKFTKISEAANNDLNKGLTIGEDNANVYVNEKGELDSYSRDPLINPVQNSLIRDNTHRRVFGYSSYYGRTPGRVDEGTYEGWNKTDITDSAEFKQFGVSKEDGFKISRLDRIEPQANQRNTGIVVEIDAANSRGYAKIKKFIKQAIDEKKEITSYRIRNMGATDTNQRFYDILKSLPAHLPQLELFFEGKGTNTQSLIALENKKIDELSLYTSGNSLKEGWTLNPLALRNTSWVNTVDYNVSFDYARGAKIPTRITFDALAFEESDLLNGANKLKRINEGLRMAYFVRNNEAVFQGGFGAGLNPDQKEGGNSYPVGLDLSRVRSLKTLRGLVFTDIYKKSNAKRYLKRIKLHNDGDTYELDTDELAEAQFDILDRTSPQMPPSKIEFSNGSETQKIKLTGNHLSSKAVTQLNILLYWTKGSLSGRNTPILVEEGNTTLYNELLDNGFKPQYTSRTPQYSDELV
ncbi:putative immunoglobulin-blocking virulence protein [Mycoplasma procyoni]|uniref:putative immunoglobulin-blocking virulence protein n=1 Tax=Mycoplasma procyoni TaxID=568784 RepID=UPI00197C4244|nr:putative immunoglobulin-blocking virulence protein [Mycoplasma procyoni]MBN3534863.1 putative immunoglobulin-blocking virulence protein [Mycoplasma procyoni]